MIPCPWSHFGRAEFRYHSISETGHVGNILATRKHLVTLSPVLCLEVVAGPEYLSYRVARTSGPYPTPKAKHLMSPPQG